MSLKQLDVPNNNLFVGINYVITFGKHQGRLLGDVAEEEPRYIVWLDDEKILKIDPAILARCQSEVDDENDMRGTIFDIF